MWHDRFGVRLKKPIHVIAIIDATPKPKPPGTIEWE